MVVLDVILGVLLSLNHILLLLLLLERHVVDGSEVVVDGLLPHGPVLQQLILGDARVDRSAVGSVHELDLRLAFE